MCFAHLSEMSRKAALLLQLEMSRDSWSISPPAVPTVDYLGNDDRAQLALWAKNLTAERYLQNVTPIVSSFSVATRFYGAPRTFGGEISHRFN